MSVYFHTPFGLKDQKLASECSFFTNRKPSDEITKEFEDLARKKSSYAKIYCGSNQQLPYSKNENQFIDIFYPVKYKTDTEIFVFFHGGYWSSGSAEMYGFVSIPFLKANKICIIVNRKLFPEASINDILDQDRLALKLIAQEFGNSKEVSLFGHSSGGHEVAMMLSTSWYQIDHVVDEYLQKNLRRVVVMCGAVDITQLLATEVNDCLDLSWQEAVSLSPVAHIEQLSQNMKKYQCKFIMLNVKNEGPALKNAAAIYEKDLNRKKVEFTSITLLKEDHFSLLQKIDEDDSLTAKIILGIADDNSLSTRN